MVKPTAVAALEKVLEAAGGTLALTRALGCSPSIVGNWRRQGGIPASRVPAVARVTGLAPEAIRPDLFGSASGVQRGLADAQAPFEAEARALGLNPDAIAAKALRDAIRAEKERRWLEENREAIQAHNDWVEKHGVPLAKYRMF